MKRWLNKEVDVISHIERCLKWIENNIVSNYGMVVSTALRIPYPEVTGYIIPTLYQWGEKDLARGLVKWLINQQNEDGSFSGPDGIPYTFDTGQVIRGFLTVLGDVKDIEHCLKKACDWVLSYIRPDGRLTTPSTDILENITDDRIHLYVLQPLIEAGIRLNEPEYIEKANRVLQYYKKQENLLDFDTLSHFHAYVIEALYDLGEIGLAKAGMEQVASLQRKDGSIPGFKRKSWVCAPGVAQYAVMFYKLFMRENADRALKYLEKTQNKSGGFYGSYGKGAYYFSDEEIGWAAKFFLDAQCWRIKTSFNVDSDHILGSIDETDGRVKEILSFFGNLNGKKVIDIGCGKGRFLRILKNKYPYSDLYGLDISEKMLDFCTEEVKKQVGSMLDIKCPDAHFDCVYCVEALEHAVRIESAIKEMVRVLKPGGEIVIIDKNIDKWGKLKLEPWERWFGPSEITDLLNKYGVESQSKQIAYEKLKQPDGLFIAWEGVRKC